MDEINKIPPVTRTMIGLALGVTVPCLLQLVSPYQFMMHYRLIRRAPTVEFYRVITSFFYAGSGLSLLFDIFYLLRNGTDLETNKYFRRTSKYIWVWIHIAAGIIALNMPLETPVHWRPLISAMTWMWSRENMNAVVSLFGVVQISGRWLPWAYLALDFVMGGPGAALVGFTGLASAYLYMELAEREPAESFLPVPAFLRSYLAEPPQWLERLVPDSVDPALGPGPTPTGGAGRSTSFGSAYAPQGRSFGSGTPGGSGTTGGTSAVAGGGRTLASSAPSGGSSWFGLFGRGSSGGGSSAGRAASSGPSREEMLAAAERRLRQQADSSIIGRHRSGASTEAPAASAGSASLSSASRTSALAGHGSEAVRRTAASGSSSAGGAAKSLSFGQLAAQQERARAAGSRADEEDASGSGGRVAEQRRAKPRTSDASNASSGAGAGAGADAQQEGTGHSWGQGNRLGE